MRLLFNPDSKLCGRHSFVIKYSTLSQTIQILKQHQVLNFLNERHLLKISYFMFTHLIFIYILLFTVMCKKFFRNILIMKIITYIYEIWQRLNGTMKRLFMSIPCCRLSSCPLSAIFKLDRHKLTVILQAAAAVAAR